MLRVLLGYLDHSRECQAIVYALEAVIEEALKEDFGPTTAAVEYWQRLDPIDPEVFDKLQSRGAIFRSCTKAKRKRHFISLLASFNPMYEFAYAHRAKSGETDFLAPDEFDQWADSEWPDPRW